MPERTPRHEPRDVASRPLTVFGIAFAAFVALSLGLLAAIFETDAPWPEAVPRRDDGAAAPELQRHPAKDLAAFRERQAAELDRVGWVDREAGIARIPVEDALRIVAERGLPRWLGPAPPEDPACRALDAAVPRAPRPSCEGAP